jgi:hypothetical protein
MAGAPARSSFVDEQMSESSSTVSDQLRELLDCAHVEVWRAMGSGTAVDWDRGFAEGVASALELLTGDDRDDLHLASVRRARGDRVVRLP